MTLPNRILDIVIILLLFHALILGVVNLYVPAYKHLIQKLKKYLNVKSQLLLRDRNILNQQERVRGTKTYDKFLKELPDLEPDFLSTEALFLYRENYLTHLRKILNIPVWIEDHYLFDTNLNTLIQCQNNH